MPRCRPAPACWPRWASAISGCSSIGQLLSQAGDQFLFIAALSIINRLTASPLALSGLALAISIPQLVFGLMGGVLVDRFNRKQLLIISDVLRALVILPVLLVHQRSEVWLLYPAAAGLAIVGTAFYPARNAIIPNIVPPKLLLSANTLIQVSYILALIFGATLAGFVVKLWGTDAAVWFDSATFLLSALLIAFMRIPPNVLTHTRGAARTVWGQLVQGCVTCSAAACSCACWRSRRLPRWASAPFKFWASTFSTNA